MKKVLFVVLLLCSICSAQYAEEKKPDYNPIYRIGIPAISTMIIYNIIESEEKYPEFTDQSLRLLTAMGISFIPGIAYDLIKNDEFKLKHFNEYGLGTLLGGSVVLIWKF